MNTELNELKKSLGAEFGKPKAKNVGKNGAKYYKGTPVDAVVVRDPAKVKELQQRIGTLKDANKTPRKKEQTKQRDQVRAARLRAKALAKRGKAVDYVPKWKK